jgi:hypothetical protein
MKIFLEARTAHGHNVLKELLELRRKTKLAERLALKTVNFSCEFVKNEPLTVKANFGVWDKVPYSAVFVDGIKQGLAVLFSKFGANLKDIEVLCE